MGVIASKSWWVTLFLLDSSWAKVTRFLFDGSCAKIARRTLFGTEVEFLLGKGGDLVRDGSFIRSIGGVVVVGIVGDVRWS